MEWISEWDYPDGKGMKQSAPFTQCLVFDGMRGG
jgi:hypothetical protein